MSWRERDSHRGKLYSAENRTERKLAELGLLPELDGSVEAAQAYADRVLRSAWWRKHALRDNPVVVKATRGSGGYYAPWSRVVSLGTEPRVWRYGVVTPAPIASPLIILHELCHHGTPPQLAAHGREFARLLLGAVRRFIGDEAGRVMRAELVAGKVPHRARSSSSTKPRGNPEALAAFRKQADGEWVVVATLHGPERQGWASELCGISTWHGSTDTVYVKSYSTRLGIERLTLYVSRANVWKTRAAAERWAARLVQVSDRLVDVRVEPLDAARAAAS